MALLAAPFLRVAVVALGSALCLAAPAVGQGSARVEGRAVDASGLPLRNAVVRLVSDPKSQTSSRPWRYTLLADSLGKFSQGGLAPGAYLVMLFSGERAEHVLNTVFLRPGGTTVLDFAKPSSEQASRSRPVARNFVTRVSSKTSALAR